MFLAQSHHSIKVSYFYCLLGEKAMQKAMQKTVHIGAHCSPQQSLCIPLLHFLYQGIWLAQLSFHIRPACVAKTTSYCSVLLLLDPSATSNSYWLSFLNYFSQLALRTTPHPSPSPRFSFWLLVFICVLMPPDSPGFQQEFSSAQSVNCSLHPLLRCLIQAHGFEYCRDPSDSWMCHSSLNLPLHVRCVSTQCIKISLKCPVDISDLWQPN